MPRRSLRNIISRPSIGDEEVLILDNLNPEEAVDEQTRAQTADVEAGGTARSRTGRVLTRIRLIVIAILTILVIVLVSCLIGEKITTGNANNEVLFNNTMMPYTANNAVFVSDDTTLVP
ncbi:hypothetical protein NEDG_02034 [Nematocida displodere]|uniref:Uncharacterized protein n=1 Tax=Nematocida displodere TaxID=1805483 RepID=A0A177EJX0_9MICR|nr:hypothetical protein NEDG_02034 [Nematocida displodere]